MKKLIIILLIVLFPAIANATWYLACDIPTDNASSSEVSVDGVVEPGLFQISNDQTALLLLDVTPYLDGLMHTFIARFLAPNSVPSEWSDPLVLGVLAAPALRLIEQ